MNLLANNNFLAGQIPNVFQNMKQLDYVDLSNNNFVGTIPESVFEATLLRLLYLSNNTLTGTIPETFSTPVFLRDLYLDGNGLTGTLPDPGAGKLANLTELLLQFNFLSGTVPASVCDLKQTAMLEDLFSDCGGSNPEILCEFPTCCDRCFEGGDLGRRSLTQLSKGRKLKVDPIGT